MKETADKTHIKTYIKKKKTKKEWTKRNSQDGKWNDNRDKGQEGIKQEEDEWNSNWRYEKTIYVSYVKQKRKVQDVTEVSKKYTCKQTDVKWRERIAEIKMRKLRDYIKLNKGWEIKENGEAYKFIKLMIDHERIIPQEEASI